MSNIAGRIVRRAVAKKLAFPAAVGGLALVMLIGLVGITSLEEGQGACADGALGGTGTLPVEGAEGEALGGIAGTGITADEYRTVLSRGTTPARIRAGTYETTSYGPPWGGINGPGIATSAGLRLDGAAPAKYFVAVDPSVISYGAWVYIWPNPFRWRGAFLAADTGGAIRGQRIDFYDWRGRTPQLNWGRQPAQLTGTAPDGVIPPTLAADELESDTAPIVTTVDDMACEAAFESAGSLELTGDLSRAEVAGHPLISFTSSCARAEVLSGITDPRIVEVLGGVLTSGRSLIITALRCDHGRPGSNHAVGRAVDIGSVAGKVCNPYGPSDPCGKLAIELGQMSGRWRSDELIASFDPNPADPGSWSDPAGHYHHIHLGYKTGV